MMEGNSGFFTVYATGTLRFSIAAWPSELHAPSRCTRQRWSMRLSAGRWSHSTVRQAFWYEPGERASQLRFAVADGYSDCWQSLKEDSNTPQRIKELMNDVGRLPLDVLAVEVAIRSALGSLYEP